MANNRGASPRATRARAPVGDGWAWRVSGALRVSGVAWRERGACVACVSRGLPRPLSRAWPRRVGFVIVRQPALSPRAIASVRRRVGGVALVGILGCGGC